MTSVSDGIMMLNNMLCAFQEISMPNLMQGFEFVGMKTFIFICCDCLGFSRPPRGGKGDGS